MNSPRGTDRIRRRFRPDEPGDRDENASRSPRPRGSPAWHSSFFGGDREPPDDPFAEETGPFRFDGVVAQSEGFEDQGWRQHRQGEAPVDRLIGAADKPEEQQALLPGSIAP